MPYDANRDEPMVDVGLMILKNIAPRVYLNLGVMRKELETDNDRFHFASKVSNVLCHRGISYGYQMRLGLRIKKRSRLNRDGHQFDVSERIRNSIFNTAYRGEKVAVSYDPPVPYRVTSLDEIKTLVSS